MNRLGNEIRPINKSLLIEPYVTTDNALLTSIVSPIKVGGAIASVAGVDIGLQKMSERLSVRRPFDGGRVMMVSNAGKWIVPPRNDLQMKDYDGGDRQEIGTALSDGRTQVMTVTADHARRLHYPFTAPGMNTTRALVLDAPAAAFSRPNYARIFELMAAGFIVLLVVIGAIFVSTRTLSKKGRWIAVCGGSRSRIH